MNNLKSQSPEQHIAANLPNSLYHKVLVNMTDTDSVGAPRPPSGPSSKCESDRQ